MHMIILSTQSKIIVLIIFYISEVMIGLKVLSANILIFENQKGIEIDAYRTFSAAEYCVLKLITMISFKLITIMF